MQGLGSTRGTVTLSALPAIDETKKNVREEESFHKKKKYVVYRSNRVHTSAVGRGTITLIVFPAIYKKKKTVREGESVPQNGYGTSGDRHLNRLTRNVQKRRT